MPPTITWSTPTWLAIAAHLMAAFALDECDVAVLVTGDTDMAPVVKVATTAFPQKDVGFLFPYGRSHAELKALARWTRRTTQQACFRFQLPDPYVKRDGRTVSKPARW